MFVGLRGQKQRSDADVKHVRYTADRRYHFSWGVLPFRVNSGGRSPLS
jgi:hypothetical protein